MPENTQQVTIRPVEERDAPYVKKALEDAFGSTLMAVHEQMFDVMTLPGFIAVADGEPVGALLYQPGDSWEVLSLVATRKGVGVGSLLLRSAAEAARKAGARRFWLITTNDNTNALRFYQRHGFDLVALRHDAVTRARRDLKPQIPLTGDDGIPIRHELELEIRFDT